MPFLSHINDLPDLFPPQIHVDLFADDTKMYYSFKNISDRIHLQSTINIFQSWSNTWLLNLATNKCAIMTIGKICPASFSIDNSILPNVFVINLQQKALGNMELSMDK